MFHFGQQDRVLCEKFLVELEELPVVLPAAMHSGSLHPVLFVFLSLEARQHASSCADCRSALADFVETRQALRGVRLASAEPGPFFVPRVMALIAARQNELNGSEGVWASVRRLAPRLVACSAVLLLLGGSWAMESQREDATRRADARPLETVFDSGVISPLNDDVLVSPIETRP